VVGILSLEHPKTSPHTKAKLNYRCHGPAGTSRLWARLYQITKQLEWWSLVLAGVTSVASEALPAFTWLEGTGTTAGTAGSTGVEAWANVGQCCGGAAGLNFMLQVLPVLPVLCYALRLIDANEHTSNTYVYLLLLFTIFPCLPCASCIPPSSRSAPLLVGTNCHCLLLPTWRLALLHWLTH
jgi:hypothetical protein